MNQSFIIYIIQNMLLISLFTLAPFLYWDAGFR